MKVLLLSRRKILSGWGATGLAKPGFGVIFQFITPKPSFARPVAPQPLSIFLRLNNETFIEF